MRVEPFRAGERQNGFRQPRETRAGDALHGHHAHEVGGAQPAARSRHPDVGSTWFDPVA